VSALNCIFCHDQPGGCAECFTEEKPMDFQLRPQTVVTGRSDADFYPTPRWCTLALLTQGAPPPGASIVDPSCGEGAILDVFRERGHNTIGVEIDRERALVAAQRGHYPYNNDALTVPWPEGDWLVGNPPYSLALDFAWKAVEWADWPAAPIPRRAALLLRLSFLEPASGRAVLFERHRPDVLILPRRPAFDGRGTDSITSAWFVWPGEGRLVWLPP